jgi:hypothetical protein
MDHDCLGFVAIVSYDAFCQDVKRSAKEYVVGRVSNYADLHV